MLIDPNKKDKFKGSQKYMIGTGKKVNQKNIIEFVDQFNQKLLPAIKKS